MTPAVATLLISAGSITQKRSFPSLCREHKAPYLAQILNRSYTKILIFVSGHGDEAKYQKTQNLIYLA